MSGVCAKLRKKFQKFLNYLYEPSPHRRENALSVSAENRREVQKYQIRRKCTVELSATGSDTSIGVTRTFTVGLISTVQEADKVALVALRRPVVVVPVASSAHRFYDKTAVSISILFPA